MGDKTNGGKQVRVGCKFHKSMEEIIDARLRNGKSKDRVSFEKITNIITRHDSWKKIVEDAINASDEEVNLYGK